MADITETLLQAMQMVASKNIDSVKFDITIEATIEDDSQAEQGKYLVSTGSTKFYAYSTDNSYKQKDTVMVTVPEGNYDNQKIILCKKVKETDTAIPYKSPFGHMIDVTNNLIYGEHEKGIFANYDIPSVVTEEDKQIIIDGCPWNLNEDSFIDSKIFNQYLVEENKDNFCIWDSGELQTPFSQYTRIGLKGQFSTFLDTYQTVSGNYGLCLMVKYESQEQVEIENSQNYFYNFYTFDSDSFYGDPYNFETYYTQEAIFDIEQYKDYLIRRLVLFIYQRDNFKTLSGTDVEAPDVDNFSTIMPNIYIKDPYICLGYDADSFVSDSCSIYTNDSLIYHKYVTDNNSYNIRNTENKKVIHLRWIHKDETTGNIGTVFNMPSDYEVRWYRKKVGEASPDGFAGANYELLTFVEIPEGEEEYFSFDFGGVAVAKSDNLFDIEYYPEVNLQEDTLKAIVVKVRNDVLETNMQNEVAVARSNLLTFENKDVIITSQDVIQTEALGIKCEDLQRGHYSIYGRNGKLLREMDSKEIRYLTAVFDYSASNLNLYSKALLTEATSVKWYCPVKNTMIKPYGNLIEDTGYSDDVYKCYIGNLASYHSIVENDNPLICYQFPYTIHPTLYHSYSNNTIRLEVIKDNITYTASITLTFNVAGTSGSAYTLDILWDNNDNVLDVSKNDDKISGQVVLYDQEGQFVPIPEAAEIELDWYVPTGGSGDVYEEGNILYPAFNGIDTKFGWNENSAQTGAVYYYYDLIQNAFVLERSPQAEDFSANRTRTLYRTKIADSEEINKKRLKYKKIKLVAADAENPQPEELNIFYNNKLNGYIKVNNLYIFNPYRTGSDSDVAALQNTDAYTVEEASVEANAALKFDFEDLVDEDNEPIFQKSKDRFFIKFKSIGINSLNSLNILKITLTNFGDYDLVALFSISLKNGEDYQGIDGATQVRYNTLGECDYIRNPYALFKLENGNLVEVNDVSWQLNPVNNPNGQFAPSLSDKNVLKPYPIYVAEAVPYGIQAKINSNIVWSQPILVYQDNYPSSTLNKWNGQDIITSDTNGTIVVNGLAAGKKENDNSFTGVILGDWSREEQVGAESTDIALIKNTGVYGMHKGAVVYALKDDGTMFLGKSGDGRIVFDGNGGIISGPGLNINLRAGSLSAHDFTLSANRLRLSNSDPYFYINNGSTTLINMSDDYGYYLQSANYYYERQQDGSVTVTGARLDLQHGYLHAANAVIAGTVTASNIYGSNIHGGTISGSEIYVPQKIGAKFSVNSYGYLTATDANIEGNITATTGTLKNLNVTGTLEFFGQGGKLHAPDIEGGTITGSIIKGSEFIAPSTATGSNDATFYVSSSGELWATDAHISGDITANNVDANTGTIGGWNITSGGLSSGTTVLDSGAGRIQTDYFVVNQPNNNYSLGEIGNLNGMIIAADQNITTNLLGIHCTNGDGILLQAGNVQVTQNNGSGRFRYAYNGNIRLTADQIYIDTDDINNAFFNNQVDDTSLKGYILAVVNGII